MDDLVKHICEQWIADGLSDECFWEHWEECPTPEDTLTPKMVLDRIEADAKRIAELKAALEWQASQPEAHPFMAKHARAALEGEKK